MFCTKCGKDNAPGAAFCSSCGNAMQLGAPIGTPPPPAMGTSGMGIASLVLGLLGFCTFGVTALLGLVFGVVALVQGRRRPEGARADALAIAGLAASALAIITIPIPAAIMFPVFAKARDKARTAACMSNLKQLSMGMMMYAQDADERMPREDNWGDALWPYTKNTQIFHCPSTPIDSKGNYCYNAQLSGAAIKDFTAPAQTAAIFDAKEGWNQSGGAELAEARHGGGLNVAFADGHVKYLRSLDANVMWDPKARPPAGFALPPPSSPSP